MSGISYTPSNKNDKNKNSEGAVLKACGKLLVGTLTLAAGLVGLAAVGTVKAVSALTKVSVKAYREHKVKQAEKNQAVMKESARQKGQKIKFSNRNAERKAEQMNFTRQTRIELLNGSGNLFNDIEDGSKISGELSDTLDRLEKLSRENSENLRALEERNLRLMEEHTLKLTEAVGSGKPLMEKTTSDMNAACDNVINSWHRESEEISREYAAAIRTAIDSAEKELRTSYENMRREASEISSTRLEKVRKIRKLADTAIHDAAYLIKTISEHEGSKAYTSEKVPMLLASYRSAVRDFESGSYETSFSTAQNVTMLASGILYDVVVGHARTAAAADELTVRAAKLSEQLNSLHSVTFVHEGRTYKDDLYRFNRAGFGVCKKKLDELWLAISPDMSETEIAETELAMKKLERSFNNIYLNSWNRMTGSYYTKDKAEAVSKALAKAGFSVEDYAFEGGDESENLHINLVNSISKERVTLVIRCDSDGDSNCEVHIYDRDNKNTSLPDVQLQEEIIRIVGRELGVELICNRQGQFSDDMDAQNLEKQQNKKRKFDKQQ